MTYAVVLFAVLVLVLFAAGAVGVAALRRWQHDLLRGQQQVVAEAVHAVQAERAGALAATVDTVVNLAADKLDGQLRLGEQQLDQRNHAIQQQLTGMNDQLNRVGELVVTLQKERAEQHGQIVNGLEEHARRASDLVASTMSLREALSSPKARGQWGERMAEDVLRLAGMVEGVNYRKQTAIKGGTIPDFTFLLPNGWSLHMDVKFPIDNYLRMINATSDSERSGCASAFGRDVRARIKELGSRGYIERGQTLDYVLAFIPNEAVYSFVHENDPALVDDALRQRVVMCSPFTLFAVLAVIRQSVEAVALERTSDEILPGLGTSHAPGVKFSEAVDQLGKRLDSAGKSYEDLAGPRRRQMQRCIDKVDDLRTRSGLDLHDGAAPALRAVNG